MTKEIKLPPIDINRVKLLYEMKLDVMLLSPSNIIGNDWKIDTIENLLDEVEDKYPELLQGLVFRVKSAIQQEAKKIWYQNSAWGLLAMATGTGKSRIPIEILKPIWAKDNNDIRVLLVVPTEKLRDEGWKEEFQKWEALAIYNNWIERTCYASLDNIIGAKYDLVIGDEWHNFTEAKMPFFKNNTIHRFIGLTATPPNPERDLIKIQLNKTLNINTIYEVSYDIAVRLKLVAPCDVIVVECRLDSNIKNVIGGTKAAPFMTTELSAYEYKSKLVNTAMYSRTPGVKKSLKFRILDRMRFLKNLESLAKNTIFILDNFIKPDERTLIFCGGIPQAERICKETFHSQTTDKYFEDFKAKRISRLSCVSSLNEGHNIDNIETIIMVCPESGDRTAIQQIGRGVRFALDHRCKIIVIIISDTVSEKWFEKAFINFDKTKFRRVRFTNLFNKIETI